MHNPALSVVVITKNEELYIRKCLEAIFKEIENIANSEVILVDSNSRDATIKIASNFPLKIAIIDKKSRPTPGLARKVGTLLAKGDFIFFVDGDKIINNGWLFKAVDLMKNHEFIGGVVGNIEEGTQDKNGAFLFKYLGDYNSKILKSGIMLASTLDGNSLLKKTVLEKVGGYNSNMPTFEDQELFLRIKKAGFEIAWLPEVMCRHFTEPEEWGIDFRKLRWRYCIGRGQFLRKALQIGMFSFGVRLFRRELLFLIYFLIWLYYCIYVFVSRKPNVIFFYIMLNLLLLFILFFRVRNLKEISKTLVNYFRVSCGIIIGFLSFNDHYQKEKNLNYRIISSP